MDATYKHSASIFGYPKSEVMTFSKLQQLLEVPGERFFAVFQLRRI